MLLVEETLELGLLEIPAMSFLSYDTLSKLFNFSESKVLVKIKDLEHSKVLDINQYLLGIAIIILTSYYPNVTS